MKAKIAGEPIRAIPGGRTKQNQKEINDEMRNAAVREPGCQCWRPLRRVPYYSVLAGSDRKSASAQQ
jgi:hypothetical protein